MKEPSFSDQLATPPTPTGPTLNPDTANAIPASSPFQVIAGIGGHGNLRPITSQIVGFFLVHLAGKSGIAFVADAAPAASASAFAAPNVPAGALQVTPTGQVASSYPGCETVFSLNLKRAAQKIPQFVTPQTLLQVQTDVREVTKAEAVPGAPNVLIKTLDWHWMTLGEPLCEIALPKKPCPEPRPPYAYTALRVEMKAPDGITIQAAEATPKMNRRAGALLVLTEELPAVDVKPGSGGSELDRLATQGNVVLEITPRPSPPGGEETKSPILGPFYMTELRAELVGKTLLGMRVDDVIRAVDYLAARTDVDPNNITVVASGHMGLVALHAAVLDKRLKHITVDHVLESYASLLRAPMPLDAPQDILPGVLLKYDIPDLVRVLGPRLTASDWLSGTADLSGK